VSSSVQLLVSWGHAPCAAGCGAGKMQRAMMSDIDHVQEDYGVAAVCHIVCWSIHNMYLDEVQPLARSPGAAAAGHTSSTREMSAH
jgi:hypothetical protein